MYCISGHFDCVFATLNIFILIKHRRLGENGVIHENVDKWLYEDPRVDYKDTFVYPG